MSYFDFLEDTMSGDFLVKKPPFFLGDIFVITYGMKGLTFFFEGLCIAIRRKKFVNPETTFILRNVLGTIGVEFSFSYFYNLGFSIKTNDFKRKRRDYKRAKLFFVRNKLNKFSRVN